MRTKPVADVAACAGAAYLLHSASSRADLLARSRRLGNLELSSL